MFLEESGQTLRGGGGVGALQTGWWSGWEGRGGEGPVTTEPRRGSGQVSAGAAGERQACSGEKRLWFAGPGVGLRKALAHRVSSGDSAER